MVCAYNQQSKPIYKAKYVNMCWVLVATKLPDIYRQGAASKGPLYTLVAGKKPTRF